MTVYIKNQVSGLATAFSLSFCIETRGVLLVFASCVARGNDELPKNRGIAQRIGDSHLISNTYYLSLRPLKHGFKIHFACAGTATVI